MNILHLFVGSLLFFVLFFGISFILNMLLRRTWFMSYVYPIIIVFIVDEFSFGKYFTDTSWAFQELGSNFIHLKMVDIIFLSMGFLGTIVSGIVIKTLRKKGYQMF